MRTKVKRTVSAVIPARDSQHTIRYTVDSLVRQTRQPDEVIVVVGHDDLTRTAIEDFIDIGLVRIMEVDPPAHLVRDAHWKRWVGAKAANGDVIFFTDSKVIVEEHAIQTALELMDLYEVMAVAGVAPAWPDQAQHFMAKVQDKGLVIGAPRFPDVAFLTRESFGRSESLPVNTTLFITRQAFECIRDDFGVKYSAMSSGYDDYVTAWLLVRGGVTILITNKVVAHHKHRLAWKDCTGQLARSGQAAAVLLFQYPDCPFGKRRFRQALAVLAMTVVSPVAAATSILAFGVIAVWIIAALAFGSFFLLGIANAIKAKDAWGFLIPPFTALLILTFVFHFARGWLKRGHFDPEEVEKYLQIH